MADDNRLYWIWLAEVFGQGSVMAAKLVSLVGDIRKIFDEGADCLTPEMGLGDDEIKKLRKKLSAKSLDRADEILSRCSSLGISVITPDHPMYPHSLRSIHDYPLVLYVKGNLPDCKANMLTAVVGTRSMSDYGRKIAYSIGAGLAFGGSYVVSGMALGSDSMALIGALEAGGTVVAVLGSGVDVIYPREHKEIYRKILEKGAVISEYPPGTPPAGRHFPVRNRIMSGLSDAVAVVEAGPSSGALITANRAIDQGRRLFAVPGKVGDEGAEGTNMLICEGAIPALSAEDILAEFEFIYRGKVSVSRAHTMLRGLDMDRLSQEAMSRTRIGTSTKQKNYYGVGSYGGRIREEVPANKTENNKRENISEIAADDSPKQKKTQPAKKSGGLINALFGEKKENNYQKTEKQTVNSEEKVIPAKKIELDALDENEIKVYNIMKPNVPVLPDELVVDGMQVDEVLSSLTILEMSGAVESGGGGYFMRVSPDDIMQSPND